MADEALDSNLEAFQRELDALREALADFGNIAAGELETAFEQGLLLLQGAAADYPPQPPDSAYRRTGTLGRLWVSAARTIELSNGAELVGKVDNATPYGPWVQDPDLQAPQHADTWETLDEVVSSQEEALQALMAQAGAGMVSAVVERMEGV